MFLCLAEYSVMPIHVGFPSRDMESVGNYYHYAIYPTFLIFPSQWSVGTILLGLYTFMLDDQPTYGSISTNDSTKRALALESLEFNVKNK